MKHVLIGEHPSIKKIRELINLVADTGYSMLLQGETGTGKEVVARLLHARSSRCHQRFIKVSCAALPLTLLESELPPLRKRREDIPLLTGHFISKYQAELKMDKPFNLNGDMSRLFQTYHWPGNVRELSSINLKLMFGDDPEIVKYELLENMKVDGETLPTGLPFPSLETFEQGKDVKRDLDTQTSLKDVKAEARKYVEKRLLHMR